MKFSKIASAVFVLFFVLGGRAAADANTGLNTAVAADITGQFGLHKGSGATNRVDVREAEVVFYSPADHLFQGTLSIAGHYESGLPQFELHEGYLSSSKLIPRTNIKFGQFFLGVGRINQIHRHDWPFTTAPYYHKRFFADEGALDTGLQVNYVTPLPFFLEVSAGLTNGFVFGHDHTAGAPPVVPTHYFRTVNYFSLPGEGGTQIGLNYLGRNDTSGTYTRLLGVDITAKWKNATKLVFLIQSELWYRIQKAQGQPSDKEFGFYIFPQYYLGGDFYLGARIDYFTDLGLKDGGGGSVKNFILNVIPTLTYQASHFSTLRLSVNAEPRYRGTNWQATTFLAELQAVFILGAHPAHDF